MVTLPSKPGTFVTGACATRRLCSAVSSVRPSCRYVKGAMVSLLRTRAVTSTGMRVRPSFTHVPSDGAPSSAACAADPSPYPENDPRNSCNTSCGRAMRPATRKKRNAGGRGAPPNANKKLIQTFNDTIRWETMSAAR